jgi:hypothetical protein
MPRHRWIACPTPRFLRAGPVGQRRRGRSPCHGRLQEARTVLLGVLVLLSALIVGHAPLAADVQAVDDAYHYPVFADGQHDAAYFEWWYFNVFDAQQGVQAIIVYRIMDPDNRSGHGAAHVQVVAYTAQGIVSADDVYAPALFSASEERADVQVAANTLQALDADTYRLVGTSQDGRLAWDLLYRRQAQPWYAADRATGGRWGWEQASWLIYMPGAQVSGQVAVDGQVYRLDARGYHDHNWGEWLITDAFAWNWAQYTEPGLALVLGDFDRWQADGVRIEVQGEITRFAQGQYRLTHTAWGVDAANGRWYPQGSTLSAENDTRRLDLRLQTLDTYPIHHLRYALGDFLVYEQTAQYEGELWEKTAAGTQVLLAAFRGQGFKEYATKGWSR